MKLLLLYNTKQANLLQESYKNGAFSASECIVVALRADVEKALDLLGISYVEGKNFRTVPALQRMYFAESVADEAVEIIGNSFWRYRDINLAQLHRISIQDYLIILTYWVDIFTQVSNFYRPEIVLLWETDQFIPVDTFLHDEYSRVVETAAKLVCEQYQIECNVLAVGNGHQNIVKKISFNFKKTAFLLMLSVHNKFTTFAKKQKGRKVLITDYWRNLAPYVDDLTDTQIVLFDRKEFFSVPKQYINAFQMQFKNADRYHKKATKNIPIGLTQSVSEQWTQKKKEIALFREKSFIGISFQNLLVALIDQGIERYKKDVLQIESLYLLLKEEKPDVVIVRASASRQVHFSTLCLLAKQLNIPSVEPQHGLFYLGPGSVPKHSTAEYLATYGPLASIELKEVGFKGEIVDVGSPRFDVYASLSDITHVSKNSLTVLFVLPDDTTGTWFDSYDIVDLVASVESLAKANQSIKIILKSRAGAPVANFGYKTALDALTSYKNVVIERSASLSLLMEQSHVVVSVFSTILVEAIAAKRIPIYWAQKGFHEDIIDMQMKKYVEAEACFVARSHIDLIEILSFLMKTDSSYNVDPKQVNFGVKNYSFSKGSPERFVALLEGLKNK